MTVGANDLVRGVAAGPVLDGRSFWRREHPLLAGVLRVLALLPLAAVLLALSPLIALFALGELTSNAWNGWRVRRGAAWRIERFGYDPMA